METMMLMPAAPGTCPLCARAHPPHHPHDAQSIFYGIRFKMQHNRDGTWADAIAHCDDDMRMKWKVALQARGAWTEPAAEIAVVAEPVDPNGGQ